MTVNKKST